MWALVAWAVVAVIGYRGVTLGAPVVAAVLVLELGMIVLFDVTSFTHPAHTDIGAWLAPWRPDLLAVDGVGGVLAFGVAAFLGFETTAAFGEEARTEHSVGRATGTCLAFLGVFYAISAWALVVAVGPDHIVDDRPRPELRHPVLRPGHRPRSARAVHGGRRGHAVGGLGARRDDRLAPGRRPLPLRARARARPPRALAFISSPHDTFRGAAHRIVPGAAARHSRAAWPDTPQRRRRGRPGGVPTAGSAAQSALALTAILVAALLGLDPIATFFTAFGHLAALGLLTLMTGTCRAVIAYYRPRGGHRATPPHPGAPGDLAGPTGHHRARPHQHPAFPAGRAEDGPAELVDAVRRAPAGRARPGDRAHGHRRQPRPHPGRSLRHRPDRCCPC